MKNIFLAILSIFVLTQYLPNGEINQWESESKRDFSFVGGNSYAQIPILKFRKKDKKIVYVSAPFLLEEK